jgi:predicted nucleic acid-binding protein
MKPRIYIDTSVIGGCFDNEFEEWSNKLFNEFKAGRKIAVISDVTLDELSNAPEKVQDIISTIPEQFIEVITSSNESEDLAELYIKEGAVTRKFYEDALHIAIATIDQISVLASWNFKHIVNLDRIRLYNAVNLKNGYSILEIRSPREILKTEDDE